MNQFYNGQGHDQHMLNAGTRIMRLQSISAETATSLFLL